MGTQHPIPLTQRRWPQHRLPASCHRESCGTRPASRAKPRLSWRLLPPCARTLARSSPVASNPTGGGLRGAVARADGAAPVRPAASPSRPLFAALRASPSAPAESDRWGPGCAHRAAAKRLNRRTDAAVAHAWCRAAGRRRARFARPSARAPSPPLRRARPGPPGPALAVPARSPGQARRGAARGHQLRLERTCADSGRRCSRATRLAARRRPHPAPVAALLDPRRGQLRPLRGLRVVALLLLAPRLAPFAALRLRPARPALRSGLLRAASPGAPRSPRFARLIPGPISRDR